MLPVSVLPAAGLLIALGRVFPEGQLLHEVFVQGGLSVFKQLPLLFAIGVAIGLTGGAGIAGLAAAVGYFLLQALLEVAGVQLASSPDHIVKIDTGVVGGIITGLLSAQAYSRFHQVKLPDFLGFFSGKRLVPIATAGFVVMASLILILVWPPLQFGIREFGQWVSSHALGPAFYAAGKRLLIPVGLHHVYYPSFLYEFGEYVKVGGEIVRGDSARYFAGDPTAGKFMASEFPIMLFGLPAAALAMVLRAEKAKRKLIAGIMLSAALTSILTGITEPIEFSFIFVSPLLYVLHVGLAFVSGLLTEFFQIHLGYTFSASLIDYVVGFFNSKNSLFLWILVGPLMFALYFISFYTIIGWKNVKTPGRDIEESTPENISENTEDQSASSRAVGQKNMIDEHQVLLALGGAENLISLDACITRLRLQTKDTSRVNEKKLKALGAAGVMKTGNNVQVVFGTQSDALKERIQKIVSQGALFLSPLVGEMFPLDVMPDETFKNKILGDGFAIQPSQGLLVSPFAGTVVSLIGSHHAIGLVSREGFEVLIHIGVDTVKLKGQGFKALVQEGQEVQAGQRLIEFDLEYVTQNAPSIMTPVIFTDASAWVWSLRKSKGKVQLQEPLLSYKKN